MSHHSDDTLLVASSDSFWEPGNYKRTTKRIEDGHRLCTDLMQLIQERATIEKEYAKSLRTWSKRWNELIEKGPEYGTTEAAWKGVLVESDRRCELHVGVKDRLINDVQATIKQWQKDTYHRSMMQLKEKKEMDDAFKKAQKPWSKILAKVNKAKADYHNACKNEKSAVNVERNATGDSAVSADQLKKMQDRVARSKEDVTKTREKYETSLQEINSYNAKYMEDMSVVFDKCQEMEDRRLKFFKEMLFGIQDCLNLSKDPALPQIYEEYRHTIQNADSTKDLKWWSNHHGVGMGMNWPLFEEYSEEFRDIGVRSKKTLPENSITLIHQRPMSEELPEYSPELHSLNRKFTADKEGITLTNLNHKSDFKQQINRNSIVSSPKEGTNPFEEDNNEPEDETEQASSARTDGDRAENNNPFEEDKEEWEEDSPDALTDNGEPGVPVRALYDYEGAESDELTFKQGEVFDKLEDEDEQGWCKGRKNGRVGLYPANYVEVVR